MSSLTGASQLLKEGQAFQYAKPPDYAAAENAYRAAILVAPGWGEPYHWLGFVLERRGDAQEAAASFVRAIQLLPDDPRPLIALGALHLRSGQFKNAVTSLEKGLALKPHYAEADARLILAEAFEGLGNIDQAMTQWRVVAQMEPSYPSYERPMKEATRKLVELDKSK